SKRRHTIRSVAVCSSEPRLFSRTSQREPKPERMLVASTGKAMLLRFVRRWEKGKQFAQLRFGGLAAVLANFKRFGKSDGLAAFRAVPAEQRTAILICFGALPPFPAFAQP